MEETLIQKFLSQLRDIQNDLKIPTNYDEKYVEILRKLDSVLCYGESRFNDLKCEDWGEK